MEDRPSGRAVEQGILGVMLAQNETLAHSCLEMSVCTGHFFCHNKKKQHIK